MTPNDVIADVRELIGDTSTPGGRFTDAGYLNFVNQAVRRVAARRPDLFVVVEDDVAVTGGTYLQSIPRAGFRVIDVIGYRHSPLVAYSPVDETDFSVIKDAPVGRGRTVYDDDPRMWARHPKVPKSYILYPPPPTGAQVRIEYAKSPPFAMDAGAEIELLDDLYQPAVVYATAAVAESADIEEANMRRADLFLTWFERELGSEEAARNITDQPGAAVERGARPQDPGSPAGMVQG